MIHKPFDQIRREDVEALVANEVKEGRTVEYKETLPGKADKEKKEFLADVSSFANAAGGDLLYGVVEKRDADNKTTGVPEGVPGLPNINVNEETLRLDQMIQTGIGPRIAGVKIHPIEGFADGPVLLIRVPKSYSAPHMVTFQEQSRFYSRNNAGKYPLDVTEIRSAFALSESLPEKVRRFRAERLGRIVAGETPSGRKDGPKVVLHLLPVRSVDPVTQIDLRLVADQAGAFQPMYSSGYDRRYNLDGFLCHNTRDKVCHSYVQVFRSGAVEATDTRILINRDGEKLFPGPAVVRVLMRAVESYLTALNRAEVDPPVFVMISLLGVQGYYVTARYGDTDGEFDRDDLLLPEVLIQEWPVDLDAVLRPIFDALWQASGWERCLLYNEQGKVVFS